MKKKFKLSEEDILAKVTAKVRNCTGSSDTRISRERERVLQAYEGKTPLPQHAGNSKYVSSDVFDGVEMMKAQLLETFAGGTQMVSFAPRDENDVAQAQMETAYVSHVIFERNPGFQVLHDAIHDGLTARNHVTKVEWVEEYVYDEESFENAPLDEVMALSSQDTISDLVAEHDEESPFEAPTYSGYFKRKIDKCRCSVEPIAPEEWFIEPNVKRREDGMRGHMTKKTKAELIADGFDPDKVNSINWEDPTLDLSPEAQSREQDTGNGLLGDDAVQDELKRVVLYQAYVHLSLKGDGKAALYRVVFASNVLFDIEEVDEDCYVDWAALRRPHTWWGNNFAARIIPTQNASTVLTRSILDHAMMTNNPRNVVVQGGLLNPRELLDNRYGGIVNVTRPDAITPLQQGQLNPFTFELLGLLKSNKEETTGISSLSQGLNKDAISNQNSEGLVDSLVSLSQIRQKIIARNFADYLSALYLKVWRVVMQNEKKEKIFEVAGQYVKVDPQAWADRRDVSISLHLGYGEQEKEAVKYMTAYTSLSQDPGAKEFFGSQERYKLLTDTFKKNKIMNYADYIKPAGTYEPAGPDPIEMMKAQAADKTAQAALVNAQANMAKVQASAQAGEQKAQTDAVKAAGTLQKQTRDADRQDLDTVNRVDVAQREIALAEKVPEENKQAIFSANS